MEHIIFIVLLYGFTSARPQNGEDFKLEWFGNYNNEAGNFRHAYQTDHKDFSTVNSITQRLENEAISTANLVKQGVPTTTCAQESQPKEDIQKEESNGENLQPEAVEPNSMQDGARSQQMNHTAIIDFASRIGANVIVTLTGPPG